MPPPARWDQHAGPHAKLVTWLGVYEAHTPGVHSGNSKGNYESQDGMLPDGRRTAEAVTGVNPSAHGPIDKAMPCLPPA